MNIVLEDKPIGEQIKFIAKDKGYSVKALQDQFNDLCNTNYSQQSFSRKLNQNKLSYDDLINFGKILGFKVKLERID